MRLQLDTTLPGLTNPATPAAGSNSGTQGAGSSGIFGNTSVNSLDSATVSGPSTLLGRLASDRAGRVQELAAAVQSGTYQIPSAAISRALISEALL